MSTSDSHRLLVTVVDGYANAVKMIERLHQGGFSEKQMELVAQDIDREAPEVETPKVHPTTASQLVKDADRGGLVGLGTGAAAGILASVATGFPGIGIGMLLIGGLTGSIVGGMAGAAHAEDDTFDLPTREEYQKLLEAGHPLVVVHGSHEDVQRAKELLVEIPYVHQHLHSIRGHEFHEHTED